MKIKRFFSQDMRRVIRMVREELGSEAVILSNNRVNGGVEIVAAIDYDESLLDASTQPENQQKNNSVTDESESLSQDYKNNHRLDQASNNPFSNQKHSLKKEVSLSEPEIVTEELIGEKTKQELEPTVTPPKVEYYKNQNLSSSSQFYNLDDLSNDSNKVSESLFETPELDDKGIKALSKPVKENVWSQEPTLVTMRNEILTLRGLLEQQLTGLAWGETERRNPIRAKLLRQLLELDLSPTISQKIADSVEEDSDYQNAWQTALTYLTDNLPTIDEDMIVSGGVMALVGPTGTGKTTTIAKLASRYALRYGRKNVGLITIDNYRVGAQEQLKTYARILDIPLRVAGDKTSLVETIKSMSDRHLVIIDTAGLSHKDVRLNNHLNIISDCCPSLKTLLVMAANTHRMALDETVRAFKNIKLDGCVLSKLDETTNLGGSLSVSLKHNLPVAYYSDGQKVPEAIHLAAAQSLVNRSVLIARKSKQPLANEAVELAFSGKHAHAFI